MQRHRVVAGIAGLLCSGLVACSKGDATPRADSPAVQPLASAPAPRQLPGALTKPIAAYTPDEFYDFVHALTYTGGTAKQRRCKNAAGCEGAAPSHMTTVMVDAIATQDSLSTGTVPQFGVVYVRALNRGDAEEARYSLPAGKQFEFYAIVMPDGKGGMRWHMQQLDTTTGARKLTELNSGAFSTCNHPWTPGARADFKTCAQSASAHDSVVHLALTLQGDPDPPLWATCSGGCCTADGPP